MVDLTRANARGLKMYYKSEETRVVVCFFSACLKTDFVERDETFYRVCGELTHDWLEHGELCNSLDATGQSAHLPRYR